MKSSLIKLKFLTPLHYGNAGKPGLTHTSITIHSDTIYSAICDNYPHQIDYLKQLVLDNQLVISDALPYVGSTLLVPRSIGIQTNTTQEIDPTLFKKIKRMSYVPYKWLETLYLEANNEVIEEALSLEKRIGYFGLKTQAMIPRNLEKDTMPYAISEFTFEEGSGLYIWVKHETDQVLEQFRLWMMNLGFSGLGGRRSSGLGKFIVENVTEGPIESQSGKYLLLSTALPKKTLGDIHFNVVKRSGFYHAEEGQFKKRDIYAIQSGLLLDEVFEGVVLNDLSKTHPIYRFLMPLFVRVNI